MLLKINVLTKESLKRFEKFVNSPYHNTYKTNKKFFYYLKSKFPYVSSGDLSVNNISIAVYNETEANGAKVRRLISDFTTLFEKFLVQEEFELDKDSRSFCYIKALGEIDDIKRIEFYYNKFEKEYNSFSSKDILFYMNKYYLENIRLSIGVHSKRTKVGENLRLLEEATEMYTNYLLLSSSHMKSNMIPLKWKLKDSVKESMKSVESNLENIMSFHPELYFLYLFHKFKENPDLKYTDQLQNYFLKKKKNMNENLTHAFSVLTYSFYNTLLLNDNRNLDKIKLSFWSYFEFFLNSKRILSVLLNGKLSTKLFWTAVIVGISIKKMSWVNEFLMLNKKYLPAESANDTLNLSTGFYNIAVKNYSAALDNFITISTNDPNYFYYSKIGQAIAFYEMSDKEGLRNSLSQLKEILRKNKKIDPYNTEVINTFCKYTLMLFNMKIKNLGFVKKRGELFREDINREVKYFFFREWLLEKVGELE